MDIRQLDYFIVVAQLGSFTKAADELFLSRQALSKAVRNLEHELGQPLLANRDNHLELTDAGRTLLDDAAPVVEAFKQLERRHVGCVGAPALRRTLSVAMAHGTALSMPDRAIDAFREEHPDIVLSVEEVTTETAIDMVRTGESDISLVGSAPQYLEEFDPMLVVETGVYAFVPEDNPLSARKELELSDLDGQPFVTFGKRNHLHRYFVEACEAAGAHPDILRTTRPKRHATACAVFRVSTPRAQRPEGGASTRAHRRAACQCVRYLRHKTQRSATLVVGTAFLAVPGFAVNEKTPPHGRGRDSSETLAAYSAAASGDGTEYTRAAFS